jgi:hypothetical protein
MCAMIKAVEAFMKTNIPCILPKMDIPQILVADFASDPLSQYEKVLKKINDSSWPLHSELTGLVLIIIISISPDRTLRPRHFFGKHPDSDFG